MNKQSEGRAAAWLERAFQALMDWRLKPAFQLTLTSVSLSVNQNGLYVLQGRPTGPVAGLEATPGAMTYQASAASGYVPRVGDRVQMVWTDKQVGWLVAPITTSAPRFLGRMTFAGPQTSGGPYNVGDYYFDSQGNIWTCSVAGSPGTWAPSGTQTLATNVLSGSSSTLLDTANNQTFANALSYFSHLEIWISVVAGSAGDIGIRFNNDSGNNYYYTGIEGGASNSGSATGPTIVDQGASAVSYGRVGFVESAAGTATSVWAVIPFSNIAANNSRLLNSVQNRVGASFNYADTFAPRWTNTTAINRIQIVCSGSFGATSRATIIGRP